MTFMLRAISAYGYFVYRGDRELTAMFAADPQMWPGRRGHGSRWQEAVETALMGDRWKERELSGEPVPGASDMLRADARVVHRQLTPIQRRKVSGQRLLSLDFALGDGLTVYDVLHCGPDPQEALCGILPDHPKINEVLSQLDALERAVAVAYANPRTMPTWTEAAAEAVAMAPAQFPGTDVTALGERVRRKLQRLGKRHAAQESTPLTSSGGMA
ncbi:hypothetical protein [Streptomyces sp. NPDC057238]|uniref:hypothetical protein n=1 Tax=Streptomyces sp. NPDC057238 TaxID=3346060 RepID=UPI00362D9E79